MVQPFIPNSVDAAITEQAEPDSQDFEYLAAATAYTGIVSGCVLSEDPTTPDMTVDVTVGVVRVAGKPITVSAQLSNTITAADGTNLRIDLVSINDSGTVVVTAGTPAAEPVAPALPATSVQLGQVYVPATDTTITDNQIVAKRTMVPSNDGFYNVKHFGAIGDGSADDTTKIQAAIDAADAEGGGVVTFGPNDYLVTATLTFYDNITLQGSNRGETRIVMTGTNTVLTNDTPGTRIFHVFVNDIQFFTSAGTPAIVIDWHSVSLGGMNRVTISGFVSSTALRLTATTGGHTIWNSFTDVHIASATTALLLTGPSINQNRFFACQFSGKASGGTGILIEDGNNNAFFNCSSETGQVGIEMTATSNGFRNVFYGHRLEGNTDGIKISGSACRGNVFQETWISAVTNVWSDTSGWANQLIDYPSFDADSAQYARRINNSILDIIGTGDPEGSSPAPPSSTFKDDAGGVGTTLYVKETGTGNTGWVAYGPLGQNVVGQSATGSRVDFQNSDVTLHDGANAKRLEILDGGNIVLYDEDGTTARLTWNEASSQWDVNAILDMGGFGITEAQVVNWETWTSTDYPSVRGTTQDEMVIGVFETGSGMRTAMAVYGPDHADAGDIKFVSVASQAQLALWDDSDDQWEFNKDIDMLGNTIRDANPAVEYATAATLDADDFIVNMESTAATRAVTLPDNATFNGKAYLVHRDGTNNVTVTRAGSDTWDDGNTVQTLATDGASIGFYSIGDGEWKISGTSGTVTGS